MNDHLKLLRLLFKGNGCRIAGGAGLVLCMTIAEVAGVLSILPFLSVMSRPELVNESRYLSWLYVQIGFEEIRPFVFFLGFLSATIVAASSVIKAITLSSLNHFMQYQRHELSLRLFEIYMRQRYEFFITRRPSDLGKNVLSEVDGILYSLIQPSWHLLSQGLLVFAMSALLFWHDPAVAFLLLAAGFLLYFSVFRMVRSRLVTLGAARDEADRNRHRLCLDGLRGIKEVIVNGVVEAYIRRFDQASSEYSRRMAEGETLRQAPVYMIEAVAFAGLIGIALLALYRTNDFALVAPTLALYGFAIYRLMPAAQGMYRAVAGLKFSAAVLRTILTDLQIKLPTSHGNEIAPKPEKDIVLTGISYAYPSAPHKSVLTGASINIQANCCTGIVGRSGTGKSTMLDILLGLLEPSAGTIMVDGRPIHPGNSARWRAGIGYVPQNIHLIDASIAENIAFGLSLEEIDWPSLYRAADLAQIHRFILDHLNDGYMTNVGECGVRLSGGQRQRIIIARSLYRDPAVLIFDEATSALDLETESALNDAIRNFAGMKTIIVVSHKPQSLLICDRVVDIQNPLV